MVTNVSYSAKAIGVTGLQSSSKIIARLYENVPKFPSKVLKIFLEDFCLFAPVCILHMPGYFVLLGLESDQRLPGLF